MRAAERQNAAPPELESAYSSYSASKKWRSAAAIAKMRGSFRSKGTPLVQSSLYDTRRKNYKQHQREMWVE